MKIFGGVKGILDDPGMDPRTMIMLLAGTATAVLLMSVWIAEGE